MAHSQELSESARREELEGNLLQLCNEGDKGFVLQFGADVNNYDENGLTPLMHACLQENEKNVRKLLDSGAMVNAANERGMTALTYACETGQEDIVKLLIKHGADVNRKDECEYTPLMRACEYGQNSNIVRTLVQSGADINVCTRHTALSLALTSNDWDGFSPARGEIVRFLLEHGADANLMPSEYSLERRASRSGLWLACRKGFADFVSMMLKYGADAKLIDGKNGLLDACYIGYEEIPEMMVENGTDVNSMDIKGVTGLMFGCFEGNRDIVKLFIKYGADINASGSCGTALMWAGHDMHNDWLVELLVEQGADVNLSGENGNTALIEASHFQTDLVVSTLITFGADVNASDKDGKTALMAACINPYDDDEDLRLKTQYFTDEYDVKDDVETYRHSKTVELLLQHGAEIDTKHKSGLTAPMIAVMKNRPESLEKMLSHNPILDLIDNKGRTVFSLAMESSGGECLRVLLRHGYLPTLGRLKSLYQVKRKDCISLETLLVTIEFGLFDWAWCRVKDLKSVSRKALKSGLCPGRIKCDHSGYSFSPLILSFIFDDKELQELLLKRLYFYPEDYQTLLTNRTIRNYRTYTSDEGPNNRIECQIVTDSSISDSDRFIHTADFTLADEFTLQPLTLFSWSFLYISKSISLSGPPGLRGQRVDSLPIPDKLKKLLKFEIVE